MPDPETALDVELGERAAYWLAFEELGAAYAELKDRAWAVVLGCFAKMAEYSRACSADGLPAVPREWTPRLDGHGMWHLPPDQEKAA